MKIQNRQAFPIIVRNLKFFGFFCSMLILISCQSPNNGEEEPGHDEEHHPGVVVLSRAQIKAIDLKLGSFKMRNLTTVVKINGQLEVPPSGTAAITAIVGGNVKEIHVFHGDKVSKGQLLAVLEHPDYISLQEEYAEIANKYEFLTLEYKRQKELFQNNVGTGRDFQQIQSELNTARAKHEGLKSRLQLLNISPEKVMEGRISNSIPLVSPISGYVNEINTKVGIFADARDILFTISDNSLVHADFMVFEKDVHLVEPDQLIHFTVSNRPEKEYTATIFAIGKEFEANLRAVHVHAKINEETNGLIPGMYITGHLHTDGELSKTLPNDAIVVEGEKSYIFVLVKDPEEKTEGSSGHNQEASGPDEGASEKGSGHQEEGQLSFRMVEVIPGKSDEGYTQIELPEPISENTEIVLNTAYYLLAEMKKMETEHVH